MEKVRRHTLSVEAMAERYRAFPRVLDRLVEGEEWYAVKDLMGRYVEVLDWRQDPEDPTTGTVDIMLFEQPRILAGREGGPETENPGASSGESDAPGCNGWLPD